MVSTASSQTVLITGASRGIGRAIAELFTQRGYTVLCPTRHELDLACPESITRYCQSLPPVAVLINNAGINELAGLAEVTPTLMETMLQVNLKAQVQLAQAVVPTMVQHGGGRIVNIASIWGQFSKPRRLLYSIAKAGVQGFTTALAVEFASQNILVNAVAPGFVATELTLQNNTPEQLASITAALPLQRLADPNEIAEAIYFLASPQNTFITGQTLFVDGGFSCV